MVKNEEYIDYLKKIIACINNGDYYSVKELSVLKLDMLKEETSLMKKELHKYSKKKVSKKELKDLDKQELLNIVNLYINYLSNKMKGCSEIKKIASIEEFIQEIQ